MSEVHLLGSILGCSDFTESGGIYCRWLMESGVDHSQPWQVLAGEISGTTHVDSEGGGGADGVFDHPVDIHYGCASVVGWPR